MTGQRLRMADGPSNRASQSIDGDFAAGEIPVRRVRQTNDSCNRLRLKEIGQVAIAQRMRVMPVQTFSVECCVESGIDHNDPIASRRMHGELDRWQRRVRCCTFKVCALVRRKSHDAIRPHRWRQPSNKWSSDAKPCQECPVAPAHSQRYPVLMCSEVLRFAMSRNHAESWHATSFPCDRGIPGFGWSHQRRLRQFCLFFSFSRRYS